MTLLTFFSIFFFCVVSKRARAIDGSCGSASTFNLRTRNEDQEATPSSCRIETNLAVCLLCYSDILQAWQTTLNK